MGVVRVYAFVVWDANNNRYVSAPRLAVLETIKEIGGKPVERIWMDVDESEPDSHRRYPKRLLGFERSVNTGGAIPHPLGSQTSIGLSDQQDYENNWRSSTAEKCRYQAGCRHRFQHKVAL
jgi:hypothetical protein